MYTEPTINNQENAPDWLIENISETAKNARKIFSFNVIFLIYCLMTAYTTSDKQIILNETVKLPLFNSEVSLSAFFILTPLISTAIFIYLQMYLFRIRGLIFDLKTNYKPAERRRLYPWIVVMAEDSEPGSIGMLQKFIAKLSLWWFLPLALMALSMSFVKKHDAVLNYYMGLMPIVVSIIVLCFYYQYDNLGNNENYKVLKWIKINLGKLSLIVIVLIFDIFLFSFIIPKANEGSYDHFRSWLYADLSSQTLAEPDKTKFYWKLLRGIHLEGANLSSTIIQKTDMREAELRNANFTYADLTLTNFNNAKLEGAVFLCAKMKGAFLNDADLKRAQLIETDMEKANLQGANLKDAELFNANLKGADLSYANLDGAFILVSDLRETTIDVERLSKAKTLDGTKLDSKIKEQIEKYYPHLLKAPTEWIRPVGMDDSDILLMMSKCNRQ